MRNFLFTLFGVRVTAWLYRVFTKEVGQYIAFIVLSIIYFLATIYAMQIAWVALLMIAVYAIVTLWLYNKNMPAAGVNVAHASNLTAIKNFGIIVDAILVFFTIFAWLFPTVWLSWVFTEYFVIVLILILIMSLIWNTTNGTIKKIRRALLWVTVGILIFGMFHTYHNTPNKKVSAGNSAPQKTKEELENEKTKSETDVNKSISTKIQNDIDQKFVDEIQAIQNETPEAYGVWKVEISNNKKLEKFLPRFTWITLGMDKGNECFLTDSKGVTFKCDGTSIVATDGSNCAIAAGDIEIWAENPTWVKVSIYKKNSKEIIEGMDKK